MRAQFRSDLRNFEVLASRLNGRLVKATLGSSFLGSLIGPPDIDFRAIHSGVDFRILLIERSRWSKSFTISAASDSPLCAFRIHCKSFMYLGMDASAIKSGKLFAQELMVKGKTYVIKSASKEALNAFTSDSNVTEVLQVILPDFGNITVSDQQITLSRTRTIWYQMTFKRGTDPDNLERIIQSVIPLEKKLKELVRFNAPSEDDPIEPLQTITKHGMVGVVIIIGLLVALLIWLMQNSESFFQ